MIVAYSYLRFSSPEQASGDSIRRQTEARNIWLQSHPDVQLDTSLHLTDAGRSGFRRDDFDTYALAEFINQIGKQVKPGSYLLVENLDRLSREDANLALERFLSIVNKGVTIVQLLPSTLEFRNPVSSMTLMFAIVELSRGNSESATKSARLLSIRAQKRSELATKKDSRKVPGWVRVHGGEGKKMKDTAPGEITFEENEHADTVRRIFQECIAGKGVHAIAVGLNRDNVPVMGRKQVKERGWLKKHNQGERYQIHQVSWNETVVYSVLTSRSTFGEFQARKGKRREAAGLPVDNYYPVVIERTVYFAAQAALKSRTRKGAGRRGKHVNLFSGLLYEAFEGGSLTYKHLKGRPSAIIPVKSKQGAGSQWMSFPAVPLEWALRSALVEISVDEITGDNSTAIQLASLQSRKNELEELIALWTKKMSNSSIANIVEVELAKYSNELQSVKKELEIAEVAHASPNAWADLQSLASLDPVCDTDDIRVRIKAAIKRSVTGVYCVFGNVGRVRMAILQVYFRAGGSRGYVVVYDPGRSNHRIKKPGRMCFHSYRNDLDYDGNMAPQHDLRDGLDVVLMPGIIADYKPDGLAQWLREHGRDIVLA